MFFFEFFKKAADQYVSGKREQTFILDLLQLRVPNLFSVRNRKLLQSDKVVIHKFRCELSIHEGKFMQRSTLLKQVPLILVSCFPSYYLYYVCQKQLKIVHAADNAFILYI